MSLKQIRLHHYCTFALLLASMTISSIYIYWEQVHVMRTANVHIKRRIHGIPIRGAHPRQENPSSLLVNKTSRTLDSLKRSPDTVENDKAWNDTSSSTFSSKMIKKNSIDLQILDGKDDIPRTKRISAEVSINEQSTLSMNIPWILTSSNWDGSSTHSFPGMNLSGKWVPLNPRQVEEVTSPTVLGVSSTRKSVSMGSSPRNKTSSLTWDFIAEGYLKLKELFQRGAWNETDRYHLRNKLKWNSDERKRAANFAEWVATNVSSAEKGITKYTPTQIRSQTLPTSKTRTYSTTEKFS